MSTAPSQAPIQQPLVIWFSAQIDQTSTDTLMTALVTAFNQGIRDVTLLLSTNGGNVMNGMTLFNFLTGLPINLTTHNVGNVDSIGNAVFLAGKRRRACAHSTFMYHGVAWGSQGPANLSEHALIEILANVQSDQRRIANLFVERTRLTQETAHGMFVRAETKTAQEALESGIVHEICEVQIPANAVVATLTAPAPAQQNAGR